MSGKAKENGFKCCSGQFFPAWEAEKEGSIMLTCNSLGLMMIWNLGPTGKYKPNGEKKMEKEKKKISQLCYKRWYTRFDNLK